MQQWNYEIIGTHLTLLIDTEEDCMAIFQQIEIRLSGFESRFSRFVEGNWLHHLNIERRWVLDTDAKKMLTYALGMSRSTDGYFDPTVWKKLTELGYGRQWIMNNEQWTVRTWFWDYRDIEVIWDDVILHGDILLEFGWVGKWYLIDIIKTYLITYPQYLINFWWDMYGRGSWKVGLESPFASDEVIGTLILDDVFLACSAPTRRKWWVDKHHLIDPKTGTPAREVIASYIEWGSGISTDSYATALCVMPWESAITTLQKTPEISGAIVRYDGIIFQKEGTTMELFA